jgi:hypothetical protein
LLPRAGGNDECSSIESAFRPALWSDCARGILHSLWNQTEQRSRVYRIERDKPSVAWRSFGGPHEPGEGFNILSKSLVSSGVSGSATVSKAATERPSEVCSAGSRGLVIPTSAR